jgi:hypothetical protein
MGQLLYRYSEAALMLVLMKWNTARTRAGFETWYEANATHKRQRAVMTRIASKIANRIIAQSLDRWYESTQTLKSQRVTLTRIASKIANRAIAQSFDRWQLTCIESARLRVVLNRCILAIANRLRRGALTQWSSVTVGTVQVESSVIHSLTAPFFNP